MWKKALYGVGGMAAILIVVGAAGFLLLQSPTAVNFVGALLRHRLGYQVGVKALSVTPAGKVAIQGLEIKTIGAEGELTFLCDRVSLSLQRERSQGLGAEVESLTLEGPHLFFRFTEKGKQKGSDLSFLERLPSVKRLEIRKGSVDLIPLPSLKIQLNQLDLTLLNFSPSKGGKGSVSGRVTVHSRQKGIQAQGSYRGSVRLSSLFPQVQGEGLVEVNLPEITYTATTLKDLKIQLPFALKRDRLSLSPIEVTLSRMDRPPWKEGEGLHDGKFRSILNLNWKAREISLKEAKGEILPLGKFWGAFQGKLKGEFPFGASLRLEAVNFSRVASLLGPLLPPEVQAWQFQGDGALESQLAGSYSAKGIALKGEVALDLQGGGFNAPDGSKAAQNLTGRLKLKVDWPPAGKQVSGEFSSQVSGGEVLWGTFYRDLSGRDLHLEGQGAFFLPRSPASSLRPIRISFKAAPITCPGRSGRGRSGSISAEKESPGRSSFPWWGMALTTRFPSCRGGPGKERGIFAFTSIRTGSIPPSGGSLRPGTPRSSCRESAYRSKACRPGSRWISPIPGPCRALPQESSPA